MNGQVLDGSKAVMMVEFGVTRQPESYQNVRCSVSLPVLVGPDDDVQGMLEFNLAMLMEQVHCMVDSEYEQGYEMPAVYSNAPRFAVRVVKAEKVAVIVPMSARLPEGWERFSNQRFGGHRLSFISQVVGEKYPAGYTVVDCTDGDWTKLPPLEEFWVWRYTPRSGEDPTPASLVLTKPGDLPNKMAYRGWWQSDSDFRYGGERLLTELEARAEKENMMFFDCTDGDFSRLPQPPAPVAKEDAEDRDGDDEE